MTRPRLLVLASTYPARSGDGVPAFVQDLAEQQAKDFDVTVLVPRVKGSAATEVESGVTVKRFRYFPSKWEDLASGAIIENLRQRPSRWLQVIPLLAAETMAVAREVHNNRPDVIHAHWIVPQGIVATLVAPRIPKVVTSLGGDLYALNHFPIRNLKSWVAKRASAATSVNTEMSAMMIALGAAQDRVHTIPMGANLRRFTARSSHPEATATRNILFVGRLVEKKGLAVLLRALDRIDHATWHLTVVGDGPLAQELKAQAEGLPVTFLGQCTRDELARQYHANDLMVVPSIPASSGDQDGLPVALLEAMGTGCAVIASDIAGINEAIVNGDNGILVPPGDEDALVSALTSVMSDPERLATLGAAAAERAQQFSVESTGKRYRELLLGMIGR